MLQLAQRISAPSSANAPLNVEFTDNYFADTLSLGLYVGGTAAATDRLTWERNAFRGLDFGYAEVYPTATDPGVIFGFGNAIRSPVTLKDNRWEGGRRLVHGLSGGTGTSGVVTATGNVNGAVVPLAFVDTGLPAGTPTRALELWADRASRTPGSPPVTYAAGRLVMHDGQLYRARVSNTNKVPPESPSDWERLPLPVDDLRTAPGTEWEERSVGLLP